MSRRPTARDKLLAELANLSGGTDDRVIAYAVERARRGARELVTNERDLIRAAEKRHGVVIEPTDFCRQCSRRMSPEEVVSCGCEEWMEM